MSKSLRLKKTPLFRNAKPVSLHTHTLYIRISVNYYKQNTQEQLHIFSFFQY